MGGNATEERGTIVSRQSKQAQPQTTEAAAAAALEIIIKKGCVYKHKERYTIIRVFTSNHKDVLLLLAAFGGTLTRRSRNSAVWTCGALPTLVLVRQNAPAALLDGKFRRLMQDERVQSVLREREAAYAIAPKHAA
jgi:hypothetical protein